MAESPYAFIERLNGLLTPDDTVVCDAGSAYYICHQALRLPDEALLISDTAQGAMGAAVPMAIGAAEGKRKGNVYVVTGDGSAYFQLAALLQAKEYPSIKVYVLINGGYKSIRDSQVRNCEGRVMGDPHISIRLLETLAEFIDCGEYEIRKPHVNL